MNLPAVVSREEWLVARRELLAAEKAATRARDALNRRRRELPMVELGEEYVFDTREGKRNLLELFDGRRQLIVYHFMFGPTWNAGCPSCSFIADNIGHLAHLHARDTTLTFVSRAPLEKITRYQDRMGWTVPWVSAEGDDFPVDFHTVIDPAHPVVEYNYTQLPTAGLAETQEAHGVSVFLREGTRVFHTYSCYARGPEALLGTYALLDLTALGRQEAWEEPAGRGDTGPMGWVRRHDEYDLAQG